MRGPFLLFVKAKKRDVYYSFSERKERSLLLSGSVFRIVDRTQMSRHVVLEFDLSGRILSAFLQSDVVSPVKIFERFFQGIFHVYTENCSNLLQDGQLNYYYDYYQEITAKNASLAEDLYRQIYGFIQTLPSVPEQYRGIVQNILRYDWEKLDQERESIRTIYDSSISVVPPEVRPDQNPSFGLIQITTGCWLYGLPRGPCAFCGSYPGQHFREKNLDEVASHIEKVKTFCGTSWGEVKKIFLLDADPLYTKVPTQAYLTLLRDKLPEVEAYESFVSTTCILSKPVDDWKELVKLGLTKVYWGVESANDAVLKILKKPHTNAKLYEAAGVLRNAGLDVVVIIISGIGHLADSHAHCVDTGAFIGRSGCVMVDISKFQLLPGTLLHQQIERGELLPVNATQIEEEHRSLIREISLRAPRCLVRGSYGNQFLS